MTSIDANDTSRRASRREFLRGAARAMALTLIAAGVAYVAHTRRPPAEGIPCRRGSLCGGCEANTGCGLPAAWAYREARSER